MSVSTFQQSDANSQTVAAYSPIVDGDISVLATIGAPFAPHQQTAPDMTVVVDAGHLVFAGGLVTTSAQTTPAFVAPTSNPRIDRIVVAQATGAITVVTGTEASSPVAPAIPANSIPTAQVLLQTTSTQITNAMIVDERDFTSYNSSSGGLLNVQTFSSAGTYTYTPTPGTASIIVEVQGGGGSGGGTGATTSTTAAASSGGGAGAYAKGLITSGFAGATVIVGAGGAAPVAGANNGNTGGASSFGSVISAPGGGSGIGRTAVTPPVTVGASGPSSLASGASIVNAAGQSSSPGLILGIYAVIGGNGGSTPFGGGGQGTGSSAGTDGKSPGTGGGGTGATESLAARSAGAGAAGIVIVYEFS